VQLELMVQPDHLVQQVLLDQQELLELKVQPDLPVHLELQELLDHLGQQV